MKKLTITTAAAFTLFMYNAYYASADKVLNAPLIKQKPELSRGCEVTSLAMLLQQAGVSIDKMTLAKKIKKVPYKINGYYGNPHDGFVGNMYTYKRPGYGVYHEPIMDLATHYLPGRILNLTGHPINEVYMHIDSGQPVWVITNSQFKKLPPSSFRTWKVKGGKLKITFHEHSVLLTGYNQKYVYLNDPLFYRKNRKVLRSSFEASWQQMGSQAITYLP